MYYHYYEYPEPHRVAPHIGIRTAQYKLIRFYGPIERWELFDIKSDPTEMHNIIETASKQLITSLKMQLLDLAKEYKDEEAVALLMK
jgi:arylsulfatase A-like enzyme